MGKRSAALGMAVLALTGAAVAIVGVTAHTAPHGAPLPSSAPGSSAAGSVASRSSGRASTAAQPPSARATPPVSMPAASIRIPALNVRASIGQADVTNGVLSPPRDPNIVGMWAGSAPLTAVTGEVTIAGHVNWSGMAPFAFGRLASLHRGDLVYTSDQANRQTEWTVTAVTVRSKNGPIDTGAFAGNSGPRRLALITCGGAFDSAAASYIDNVYVYAVPLAA